MRTLLSAGSFACLLAAAPAAAQEGLVDVSLEDVRLEIAKNLNIDLQNVPVTILLPVSVAANLCGLEASALAGQTGGSQPSCTATNSTMALQYVTNTINSGTQTGTGTAAAPAATTAEPSGDAPAEGAAPEQTGTSQTQ